MHGQSTLRYLNDKAVADAILAKHQQDPSVINPAFQKAVEESLVKKAK